MMSEKVHNRKRTGLCLLVFLLTAMLAMPSFAATKKTKAMAAYRAFLEGRSGSIRQFGVLYLNKDSVPELAVGKDIYTYKNNKVVKMDDPVPLYQAYAYYKKKGVLVQGYAHGGYFPTEFTYYCKMSGTKLIYKLEIGKYGEVNQSSGKVSWSKTYSKATSGTNGKKVSKAKFKKALKKMVGSKKMTKIKYRDNTAANRKKYLK